MRRSRKERQERRQERRENRQERREERKEERKSPERKKERKERRKKLAGKINRGIKRGIKWATLLPLQPAMISLLAARGKKVPRGIENRAKLFHATFISKNFEETEHLVEDAVSIIRDIIGFFKRAKQKKEAGENLSETERIAAEGADEAEKVMEERDKQEAAGEEGGTDTMKIVLIAVGGIVALLIVGKLAKWF
jgi:hypothetical protein